MRKDFNDMSDADLEQMILDSDEIIDVHKGTTDSFAKDFDGRNSGLKNKSIPEIVKNYDDRKSAYLGALDKFVKHQLTVG